MARTVKKKRTISLWSASDVRALKAQAGKAPASRIAKQLKRRTCSGDSRIAERLPAREQ